MVIGVKNLDRVMKKFDRASEVDMRPFIKTATKLVHRTAYDLAPVSVGQGVQADPKVTARGGRKGDKGGYLRRNIVYKTYGKGPTAYGIVSNNVDYAIYQEFGTYKMRPQPFMIPALTRNRATIEEGAEGYIKNYLDKVTK